MTEPAKRLAQALICQAIRDMLSIIEGIDQTEVDNPKGWWETSTGAEFGAGVKAKLIALLSKVREP